MREDSMIRFTGDNSEEVVSFLGGFPGLRVKQFPEPVVEVDAPKGLMRAYVGDWIVRKSGEIYFLVANAKRSSPVVH